MVYSNPAGELDGIFDHYGSPCRQGQGNHPIAGADFTPNRGFFSAYDVNTGREVALLHCSGRSFEAFRELTGKAAKTWSGEWWKYGGGGSVWDGCHLTRKPT